MPSEIDFKGAATEFAVLWALYAVVAYVIARAQRRTFLWFFVQGVVLPFVVIVLAVIVALVVDLV